MARFIALPVNVGDSFFLERGGRSILVDGGMSKSALPLLLKEHTGRMHADIIVCTHNDADHANGLIGLLEAGGTARELWLPGRWLGTMPDLLEPHGSVVDKLASEVGQLWIERGKQDVPLPSTLEELGGALSEAGVGHMESTADGGPEGADDWRELADEPRWPPADLWADHWHLVVPPKAPDTPGHVDSANSLWKDAIDAATKIRAIAQLAAQNGLPVRWFEHRPDNPAGGVPGFLEPVSCRQIARVFPYLPLLFRLSLSKVNRESLVFYSPPGNDAPGVLFCGDSDLVGATPTLTHRDLITVPHHGSEANAPAYTTIAAALGGPTVTNVWVRSDKQSAKRPGPAYLSTSGKKVCTVCRGGPPKQTVLLIGRQNLWARSAGLRTCVC